MTQRRRDEPQSDARRKAARPEGGGDISGQSGDGRVSSYPGSRAYRPERVSNHDGINGLTLVRQAQRASRAPVSVRAGDSVSPPSPSEGPRAVDGHPLDCQEDTNPGLGSIRGMGFPSRPSGDHLEGEPTIIGAGETYPNAEGGGAGPSSAAPVSVERRRALPGNDSVTRFQPVSVSERERGAARAALAIHSDARAATVRGLGGFSVAPALDAALGADDCAESRGAASPGASKQALVARPGSVPDEELPEDWASDGYFDGDPASSPLPQRRWGAPLVGVVLLVSAGVLVFAAVQRFIEQHTSDAAELATKLPQAAMATPAERSNRAGTTVEAPTPVLETDAPRLEIGDERQKRLPRASVAGPLAAERTISDAGVARAGRKDAARNPVAERSSLRQGTARSESGTGLPRVRARTEAHATAVPSEVPVPKRVPDEPLF